MVSLTLIALFVFSGCENNDNDFGNAELDLGGDWSGRYRDPDGNEVTLTAYISHKGNSVILDTSMTGVGHHMEGNIDADNHLALYDQNDGEEWTSYDTVSEHYIRLRDYIYDEELRRDSPEQTIYLSR